MKMLEKMQQDTWKKKLIDQLYTGLETVNPLVSMRSLTLSLTCIMTLGGFSISSVAGTIDPQVSDSKYLSYGQRHKCVARIGGDNESLSSKNSKARFNASAVVVRPRIVITAAHVVDGGSNIWVSVGDQKSNVISAIHLTKWKHEDVGPYDIAVCLLDKDIKLDFYPKLYSKKDEMGKVCSISGYGITGTHRSGAIKKDYKKRAGSNIIDNKLFNGMLVCSIKEGPHTTLEFLISQGDSGGGLFIDGMLAGINSSIMKPVGQKSKSTYNTESCHTRISLHKEWLEKAIKALETTEKNPKEKLGFL